MPVVYSYKCPNGHVTELVRRSEDANRPARCDTCGEPARRLYGLGGVGFKGEGFSGSRP